MNERIFLTFTNLFSTLPMSSVSYSSSSGELISFSFCSRYQSIRSSRSRPLPVVRKIQQNKHLNRHVLIVCDLWFVLGRLLLLLRGGRGSRRGQSGRRLTGRCSPGNTRSRCYSHCRTRPTPRATR